MFQTSVVSSSGRVRATITVLALVVTGCSASAGASAAPSATATAAPTLAPAASPAAASPSAGPSAAAQRVSLTTLGRPTLPSWSVASMPGWHVDGGKFYVGDGPVIGLSVWEVGGVPTDPCHPLTKPVTNVGGSVDTVAALQAQPGRKATKPQQTKIGGKPAVTFDLSVPTEAVVTGDADFQGCDRQSNGHLDYISFIGSLGGTRYEQEAGQTDRLWVVDLDQGTVVVDATWSKDVSARARADLDAAVASLRFDAP